jgi:septum formation protein
VERIHAACKREGATKECIIRRVPASARRATARLLLASASPRRRELLERAGIPCDVEAVDVAERRMPEEAPREYVERLARAKAAAAVRRHPHRVVLGADTIVVADSEVLEKPVDDADAARMLRQLSNRAHDVLTGIAVAHGGDVRSDVVVTRVWFAALSDADVSWYVASGEPADKAGAYGIQGLASRFVTRIDGSYANVVGLPVAAVVGLLRQTGLAVDGVS